MKKQPAFLALLAFVLSGCATPPPRAAQDVSYLSTSTCAIFYGELPGKFPDQEAAKFWDTVDRQISKFFFEYLKEGGYRVVKSRAPGASEGDHDSIMRSIAETKCGTVIQLALQVDEEAGQRKFGYDVTVLRFVPGERTAGGTNVTSIADYSRKYRYPRTPATFSTFRTGEFAYKAYEDLDKSGVIARLRQR